MITFTKLKYKNFLSSGNYWTELNLSKNNSTLIIGSNGAGKSTMLDALTFVLFNKPFRKILKNQLVNTVNEKDCLVEIYFNTGKIEWKIVRGIKPNIFLIYKDDILLDQASSSNDQQKWLEQSVIKLNYKSFTQIVILGSTNFVPFMQLSSQHRREVVEDLLDIKIFSSMNDIAKYKIKELKDGIKDFEYKKQNIEDKIDSQKNFIDKLSKISSKEIEYKTAKILDLNKNLSQGLSQIQILTDKVKNLNIELEKFSGASDKIKKLISIKSKISQKISIIEDDSIFFKNNSSCPTCTQTIDNSIKSSKIKEIENKIKELKNGFEEVEKTLVIQEDKESNFLKVSKSIVNSTTEISQHNIQISEIQKQLISLQSEIDKLSASNYTEVVEQQKLKEFLSRFDELLEDMSKCKEELSNYEFIHMLLKDDAAKSKIIKKYLPVINKTLNKYLEIMEFSVNFHLDEEFSEKSLNPIYEDFSYSSFSEGEKMRIDLSLMFTWREIAKIKNSVNTNLLILDEVFDSSLDDYGTDNFTKIIRYIIKDSNVIVISHKTSELEDKFDDVIRFEKSKGFSVMLDS